ncbi:hypothetical protein GQ44DRAFT_715846 [Phaeosphaeriaceae sp. PMI808]|nr:hypothetical protein GQ44DRAFT_715846 [Phaeosphaeriaceae sp. PMI808]
MCALAVCFEEAIKTGFTDDILPRWENMGVNRCIALRQTSYWTGIPTRLIAHHSVAR